MMTVVEGLLCIWGAGGVLFLIAAIVGLVNNNSTAFNYGITIAIFLLLPALALLAGKYIVTEEKLEENS